MGFEIITKDNIQEKEVDLTVVYDQEDQIFITGHDLHAYCQSNKELIKKTYSKILESTMLANVESISLPVMHNVNFPDLKLDYYFSYALEVIEEFLEDHELNIYLVIDYFIQYNGNQDAEKHLYQEISEIISKENTYSYSTSSYPSGPVNYSFDFNYNFFDEFNMDEALKDSKEVTFGQHLLDLIDEKGYAKYSTVYNKAIIDRRLFHNIISKDDYLPKKNTVILLALALELNEEEAKDFLSYAGYAFSNSRKDQIILQCIKNKYFNVMRINGYLYDCGLMPLLNIE